MFDLSWSHIAILVVVALLVLGPKELPNAIRTGAQLLRTGRKLANEFRSGMDDLLREAELEETRRTINQAMSEGVEKTLIEKVDPEGEIKSAISVDPLLENSTAEHSLAADDSGPKVIEHDAPPAPAHSILPPAEEAPAAPAAAIAAVEPPPIEPLSKEPPSIEPPSGGSGAEAPSPAPAPAGREDQKQGMGS